MRVRPFLTLFQVIILEKMMSNQSMVPMLRNRVLSFVWAKILSHTKSSKAVQTSIQNLIIEGAAIEVTLGLANGSDEARIKISSTF